MFRQLTSVPKIPLIVVGTLIVLLALPGMPKWPMGLVLLIVIANFFAARRGKQKDDAQQLFDEAEPAAEAIATRPMPPVEVLLGRELSQQWVAIKAVADGAYRRSSQPA